MKEGSRLYYDYFDILKKYLEENYEIMSYEQTIYDINVENILGIVVDEKVKFIYEHYKKFNIVWFKNKRYWGEVNFIPFIDLDKEHDELIRIMKEIYDVESDDLKICQSIMSWYPLFYFRNGDAICVDKRDGSIRFYDHEVYDNIEEVGIFGIKIANSINDLFEKWGILHFADIYYWDEVCNEDGIDVKSDFAQKFI